MGYEIRAMSFGEILDTGFRLVRDHFGLFLAIGAVMYVPLGFAGYVLEGAFANAAASPDAALGVALTGLGLGLASALVSPIVVAAITHAIAEKYLGREATFGSSLRVSISILLPLLGTFLLYTLAILGGFFLLLIPGFYFMLAFLLVNQVMVIERTFGTRALRRSRELMRGHLMRGFGILFVAMLIMMVLQTGVDLALSALPVVQPLGTGLVQAVSFAFYSAVGVLLYFDLRCRKEAFDLEHLSRVVAEGAAARA